jgi:hypothetical protein
LQKSRRLGAETFIVSWDRFPCISIKQCRRFAARGILIGGLAEHAPSGALLVALGRHEFAVRAFAPGGNGIGELK